VGCRSHTMVHLTCCGFAGEKCLYSKKDVLVIRGGWGLSGSHCQLVPLGVFSLAMLYVHREVIL